jgi:hypothetical protein
MRVTGNLFVFNILACFAEGSELEPHQNKFFKKLFMASGVVFKPSP